MYLPLTKRHNLSQRITGSNTAPRQSGWWPDVKWIWRCHLPKYINISYTCEILQVLTRPSSKLVTQANTRSQWSFSIIQERIWTYFTTNVPGIGIASTHFPAVFCTCRPPARSCQSIVKHWNECLSKRRNAGSNSKTSDFITECNISASPHTYGMREWSYSVWAPIPICLPSGSASKLVGLWGG